MGVDVKSLVAALASAKDIESLEAAIACASVLDNTPGEDRQKLRGAWQRAARPQLVRGFGQGGPAAGVLTGGCFW